MDKSSRILITGGTGLVGTALRDELAHQGYVNVTQFNSETADLREMDHARGSFVGVRGPYIFHCAARVYGIMGNMQNKGQSFLDNVLINTNVIEAARQCGVRKIVAMGSGCVYPYPSPGLPLKEDMIWSGAPHPSEDSYAHAKRAMLAQLIAYKEQYGMNYAYVISGNLYGHNDKFDVEHGHVIPSLIRKFYEAKETGGRVTVWGTGSAQRDFMYSGDAARALIDIMNGVDGPVNMGSGMVHSIRSVVDALTDITDMHGRVDWDASKPDGQDYRAYDFSGLHAIGFKPDMTMWLGLEATYRWYSENKASRRM